MVLRILFVIDGLAAIVLLLFFGWGLQDGTISSFNIEIWLTLLAIAAAALGLAAWLAARAQKWAAAAVLLLTAVPIVLIGLFFLAAVIINPRWN